MTDDTARESHAVAEAGGADEPSAGPGMPRGPRRSVFWRVAGILVGVQVVTGLLAVALSARFAYDRSLALAENSLRLRLDGLAEEVERAGVVPEDGLEALPRWLRLDLSSRFLDPVFLLDAGGAPLLELPPNPVPSGADVGVPPRALELPVDLRSRLDAGEVVVQVAAGAPGGTWGLAPVYDDFSGLLAGGLLVWPLDASLEREMADARAAFIRALVAVTALAVLIAVLLGAFFTWRLVQPLRRMTTQVEQLGAGHYATRIALESGDEFGRLATAINQMAAAVERSIEALRTTDRLRRELVANVGHDLRTPLAALLGYVEEGERLLAEGDGSGAAEAFETARRQGHYLERLVGDLFELSLLGSARPPLHREPVPVAELLTDAVRAHRAAFEQAGIAFRVEMQEGLPLIEADGVRLLRVFDNLLSNARRYTPEGGTVRLHAYVDAEGAVCVQVSDTGPGLTPEEAANVFDRYYRGREARTRTPHGTGLGLPISRAIARAHGGDLTVQSSPGQGCTFTLRLAAGG